MKKPAPHRYGERPRNMTVQHDGSDGIQVTAHDDAHLAARRWTFWLRYERGKAHVVLDAYEELERLSRRHKWRPAGAWYSRLTRDRGSYHPGMEQLDEAEVWVPALVQQQAQRLLPAWRFVRWSEVSK